MPLDAKPAPALPEASPEADAALPELLRRLDAERYRFITPTPASHARVIRRPTLQRAHDLRGVFGWNLPFDPGVLPPDLLETLQRGGVLAEAAGDYRSRVRVSSVGEQLFLHSAFPTLEENAVFFGPDSYRFARFILDRMEPLPEGARIVDVGAGAGVGGLVAGRARPDAEVWLTDINPAALRLAQLNADHAGQGIVTCLGTGMSCAEGEFDAVLINPPYIIDRAGRAYRDGGDLHGAQMALDLALEAVERLKPGGKLLLYTGAPIVDGRDELQEALAPKVAELGGALDYQELDPDVFGEELERPEYAEVDRIAVVGAVVTRQG